MRLLLAIGLAVALGTVLVPTSSRSDEPLPLKALRIVDLRVEPGEMRGLVNEIQQSATRAFLANQIDEMLEGFSVRLHAMNLTVLGRSGGALGAGTLRLTAYDGVYSAAGEGLATFDDLARWLCASPSVSCELIASAQSDSLRTPDGDPLPTYGVIEVAMDAADREDIHSLATGFLRYKGFVDRYYAGPDGLVTVEFGLHLTITITYRLSGPAIGLTIVFTDGPIPPTAEEAAAMVDEVAKVIASRPAATVTIVE